MKKNKRKNFICKADYLSANQTDQILSQIIADSKADYPKASAKTAFGRRAQNGYFFKTACILCCVLLFLAFFIPGTVTPAPISNVTSASPSTEKTSSLTVNFQINSLVPLQEVSARMNNKPAEVKQESYACFFAPCAFIQPVIFTVPESLTFTTTVFP